MTGVSTYGRALSQMSFIKDQNTLFSTLSTQMSTGLKTQKFSGLGTQALATQRARTDINSLETYKNNITQSETRIKMMLNAIEEFKAQAENFSNTLVNTMQESTHQNGDKILYDNPLTPNINEAEEVGMTSGDLATPLETVRDLATNMYDFMTDLLNVKEVDRYLLSGTATDQKPLKDSSTLDSAISTLIGTWKDETAPTINADRTKTEELISALESRTSTTRTPNAITDTIIGFSSTLSSGSAEKVTIRVDDLSDVNYTALANDQSFRDILVAVAYFKNDDLYPMADVYAEPYTPGDPVLTDPDTGKVLQGAPGDDLDEMKDNFFEVYNALTTMVAKAIDDIDQVRFSLETARERLNTIKESHRAEEAVLLETIADIEQVDTSEVAIKIQMLQIQLDASYRITAMMGELSLTRFI
ncbi:MAG: hypothetical protein KTR28_07785 [Micavibrio sp.]|nr:hypothetical protein [Micavibrio sp.]